MAEADEFGNSLRVDEILCPDARAHLSEATPVDSGGRICCDSLQV